MAAIWTLRSHPLFQLLPSFGTAKHQIVPHGVLFGSELTSCHGKAYLKRLATDRESVVRAVGGSLTSGENDSSIQDDKASSSKDASKSSHLASKFQGAISSVPPLVSVMKRHAANKTVVGLCAAVVTLIVAAVKMYTVRKARYSRRGSVADLVRRGQLRSDRRGISKALKYEDPFNNPFVKVGKSNSTIEMCGKVYKLAPVTLTKEEQAIHQKRRSRAYQWKRPKVFLKEGDSIPPEVDPDTVRWIPANHPFATTASEIDEDLAQNNVYQKHGVPFRIQAEHEALQRKLEALQNEEKLDKLVIDSRMARDYEQKFKLSPKSDESVERGSTDNQAGSHRPYKGTHENFSGTNTSTEDK